MTIDWKLLVQLRERHKLSAHEAVAQERRAAAEREAQLVQSRGALDEQVQAKAALWQQASAGSIDMGALRQTAAWSGALDRHIAQARRQVSEAEHLAYLQEQRLQQRRRELREACGDLTKAEQMQSRARAAQRRLAETRAEDVAEEHAVQRWTARKPS
jgi:hypothetical protein